MANFFNSSIGKKLMMGAAGLFLCVFLLLHLSINLLLLRSDGGAAYMIAVGFMSSNIFIKVMEIVLGAGFLLHIIYGIVLQVQNWLARPSRYKVTHSSQTSFFSKYMIHTGAIIFAFLALHLMNFYFVKLGISTAPEGATVVEDKHDFYHMVINLFLNPYYSWLYIAFMIFLGFHLHHALQSAFQTMGISHPKYSPIIKGLGWIYSVGITIGFSIIPIYILYFFKH